ncbi:MAG: hypothetical protein GEU90_21975 [Gemmatimonas sp.]|nr:hypothetical protein [Gemmatimonas sp.]
MSYRRSLDPPARSTPNGRTLLVLSPLEFLAALARLIPPPRVHRHRYHGVLAPNAALRARLTALARESPDAPPQPASADPESLTPAPLTTRSAWARRLARI